MILKKFRTMKIDKFYFHNFISIHTKQLDLGLTVLYTDNNVVNKIFNVYHQRIIDKNKKNDILYVKK